MKKAVNILVAMVLLNVVHGQQHYNTYSFNEQYGFDITTIYSIKQDKKGDFWFGTDEGLVHFNGYQFNLYFSEKYERDASNIKFDGEGRIWYSNFGGQLFYVEHGLVNTAIEQPHSPGFILDYFPSSDTTVIYFVYGKTEIIRYNIKHKTSTILWELLNKEASIISLKQQTNQLDIVAGEKVNGEKYNIVRYNYDLRYHTTQKTETNIEEYESQIFINYFQDSCYYFHFKHEEFGVLNLDRHQPILFTKQNISFSNSIFIDDNKVFLMKKNGVQEFSLTPPYKSETFMPGINASSYLKDKEGNIWIGSLDEGIQIIPNSSFKHKILTSNKINQSAVSPDGTIYFLDSENKLFMSPYPYSKQIRLAENMPIQSSMTYEATNKSLFLSNYNQAFPSDKNQVIPSQLKFFKQLLFLDKKRVILTRGESAILTTIDKSPIKFNDLKYDFGELRSPQENNYSIMLRKVRCELIAETKDKNHIYIDYVDGLYHYSHSKKPVKLQFNGQAIHATTLVSDRKAGVWVTTLNQELIKIDGDRVTFKLRLPETAKFLVQNNNVLFLSCKSGIFRISIPTKEITLINKTDGLLKEQITSLFCYRDSLFIVTRGKVQFIPCSYNHSNTTVPEIFIDGVLLFNVKLPLKNDYLFSYDENNLTFYFRTNAIRGQDLIKYQYRLSQGDWITVASNSHQTIFSNLGPGDYTFEVRVVNEDGIASPSKKIKFTIEKHFTKTWWFLVLCILSVLLIILLTFRYRYKTMLQQNVLRVQKQELKTEVYKAKIAALRSQMNPHFIFNALNTIQEFIITNQKEIASDYLVDFADLIRKYLEQSRKEEIYLDEEIETLEIYLRLENLRSNDQIDYSIYCDPLINRFETLIPVMLLQPFVENAIKHGLLHKVGHKSLRVSFNKKDEKRIRCCIEDSGIGREAASKLRVNAHPSFSTLAFDEKMELLNKNSTRNISIEIQDLTEENTIDTSAPLLASGTKIIIEFDLF